MQRAFAVLVACAAAGGCNALLGIHELGGDGGGIDGVAVPTGDGGGDAGPDCLVGRGFMTVCNLASGTISLSSTMSTEACARTMPQPSGDPVCVIAANNIDVDVGGVRFEGKFPVVLAANQIAITGLLDVSSTAARAGAGANDPSCKPGPPAGSGVAGGGGGAGGSSLGGGGNGGAAGNGAGMGGIPGSSVVEPTVLRGGCPGGDGGSPGQTPAPGGSSGGAVYLLADRITVDGQIDASGGGGGGGDATGGGGGGGAGGMIVLDAPTIVVGTKASVIANGGGGGAGATVSGPGGAGSSATSCSAAPGAPSTQGGGAGGDSSGCDRGTNAGEAGADATSSGGGGGGGAGWLVAYTFGPVSFSDEWPTAAVH